MKPEPHLMEGLALNYSANKGDEMNLQGYVDKVHRISRDKGWWPTFESGELKARPSLEMRMLMVTEIAEASEEVRGGKPDVYWKTPTGIVKWGDIGYGTNLSVGDELQKPEGEAIELADCVIRIMDYFGANKWNLDHHMEDSFHLPERERSLETHMEIVSMISMASGDDEEKMLGRVVKVIKEYFMRKDWDFEAVVRGKIEYNASRPWRHGGKLA
jgi:hypothetical protein